MIDEMHLLDEIMRLVGVRYEFLAEGKVKRANKVSELLFELERQFASLPDGGVRILLKMADSDKDEIRIKAAFHLIPLRPNLAKKLLVDIIHNTENVPVKIEARTTLEEWTAGRLNYRQIMDLQ